MNDKKPWTDDLRDRLSQYEAKNVPQGLWDDIAKSLDARKGRVLPWRRIACAAAVVALAIGGVGVLWNGTGTNKEQSTTAEVRKEAVVPTENSVAHTSVLAMQKEKSVQKGNKVVRHEDVIAAESIAASNNAAESTDNETHRTEAMPSDTEKTKSAIVRESGKGSSLPAANNDFVNDRQGRRETNRGISVSLYASNLMSSSNNIHGYGYQHPVFLIMSDVSDLSTFASPMSAVAYSNRNEVTTTSTKHHQPIGIGVGARYFFSHRWAVESGISYMMLESETKSGTDHSYAYTDEKVRYIGVPLAVGYQLIDAKRLSVYGSMGVQAYFGISGKQECQYVVDDQPINEPTKANIESIPVQWSMTAAAGVQYNILGNLGIYAEPGVAYYIDNGSSLHTSYNDKKLPLVFNLKVGLRYDLGK